MGQLERKWLVDDIIDGSKIEDDAVDSEHIAADAVDSEHYAAGSIDSEHIANDQVDSQHYAAGSIDHEHLADDVITGATAETTVNGSDEVLIYDQSATALRRMTVTNLGLGAGSITLHAEPHVITAGEVTAGYFTLTQSPVNATHVQAFAAGGIPLLNDQISPTAQADFTILSTNQFHFNNNGAAGGLSELLVAGDEVIVQYGY